MKYECFTYFNIVCPWEGLGHHQQFEPIPCDLYYVEVGKFSHE